MFNGVGINCSCVAMCTCRCVHRTIKRSCEARYTKPAALETSAAHKCCIKCKAIVGTSAVHKCCAQVLCSCANMYCLPFCAHYHETRTRRTSHVCAHRTLQRVSLNARYTFKQSSMLNGVGINCSYVAMCTCRCVHQTIKRPSEARYTKPGAMEASAAHKCCIKCKAIVGTSVVHKCCAHARTYTACLFAHITMKRAQSALRMFARIERCNEYL